MLWTEALAGPFVLQRDSVGRKNMKYLQNVRNTMTPRSAVLLAVALLGTGFAARAYRRRKKFT